MINDGMPKIEKEISSFLLIGQSNMAGRGDFGEVEPIDNPDCFMLRMGRWQKMSEPINPDRAIFGIEFHSGISLGASFADSVANGFGVKVGLIPCADGGTFISQWMPGEVLFDHAVMMCELAARSSDIKAILWHQGESDANPECIGKYKEKFTKMAFELRKRLGNSKLPILIGEISEKISDRWNLKDYPRKMNVILSELASEIENCRLVKAADLPLKADGIHFTSDSQRILGARYFEAYKKLIEK